MADLFCSSGAHFSPCRIYRYRLWRSWTDAPVLCWIMLNPSTADENANDPTVERCERRARAMEYGGILVVNLFALRSTEPAALYGVNEPVGPDNDAAILYAAGEAKTIVCAWGKHGRLRNRGPQVAEMLRSHGFRLSTLKLNSDGQPAHPLYLPYSARPEPWRADAFDPPKTVTPTPEERAGRW